MTRRPRELVSRRVLLAAIASVAALGLVAFFAYPPGRREFPAPGRPIERASGPLRGDAPGATVLERRNTRTIASRATGIDGGAMDPSAPETTAERMRLPERARATPTRVFDRPVVRRPATPEERLDRTTFIYDYIVLRTDEVRRRIEVAEREGDEPQLALLRRELAALEASTPDARRRFDEQTEATRRARIDTARSSPAAE